MSTIYYNTDLIIHYLLVTSQVKRTAFTVAEYELNIVTHLSIPFSKTTRPRVLDSFMSA